MCGLKKFTYGLILIRNLITESSTELSLLVLCTDIDRCSFFLCDAEFSFKVFRDGMALCKYFNLAWLSEMCKHKEFWENIIVPIKQVSGNELCEQNYAPHLKPFFFLPEYGSIPNDQKGDKLPVVL